MPHYILMGLAGGFASAVLFMSATAGGTAGRILLYFLTPLPSFLAGLGWGSTSALIAALAASTATGFVLGGIWPAFVFLVSQGVPIVLLCHFALLDHAPGDRLDRWRQRRDRRSIGIRSAGCWHWRRSLPAACR